MFVNYLVTALRNIVRHKLYSFINIAGLALGLACVIFIMLFIRDEISYDAWLPDSSNLYRVDVSAKLEGRPTDRFALSPYPVSDLMKAHLPEVTGQTHFWPVQMTVQVGARQFLDAVSEADSNFFTLVGLPLVAGDPSRVLQRPESIVLSQTMARKYFGNANPVGRLVVLNRASCSAPQAACPVSTVAVRVTGVMRDLPHNTQFKIDAVIPTNSPADRIGDAGKKIWFNFSGYAYVRLTPGSDPAAVATKFRKVMDRLVDLSDFTNIRKPAGQQLQIRLVPFRDAHMDSGTMGNQVPPGSWTTLYGLGMIGLVILLAACFNFTNLATARAMMRAREIGLRKCVGARRRQVAIQFLGESVVMALVALVFALAVVEILLPAYDSFLNRPIDLNYLRDMPLLLVIAAIAVAAGLVSGVYPALVLSGFRPIMALRSNQSGHAGSGILRAALVVAQFAVSIGLAIATLVVFAQINHARKEALGFRHDNILVVETSRGMTADNRESLMAQLRTHPGVAAVAASSDTPFSRNQIVTNVKVPGHPAPVTLSQLLITPRFLELYDMKLAAGRLLSDARAEDAVINQPDAVNDGHNVLINATAARYLGYGVQDAVGKTLYLGPKNVPVHIAGVLRDVRFKGARNEIPPSIYFNDRQDSFKISLRLVGSDIAGTVAFVDRTWRRMVPSTAINRYFLDSNFDSLYQSDQKQGEMFAVFVGIAILISCLGLFGLAAFTAGRRTHEIGIRKVFGARNRDVVLLLLWQFSLPVLLANLIAWPLAWYYLHGWLQGFADHVALNLGYFLGAGLAALLIAWATVITHALHVARANPVHALRHE